MTTRWLVLGWLGLCSSAWGEAVAKLPDKAPGEWVAIVDLRTDALIAWEADGKPGSVDPNWPKIFRTLRGEATHGFVVRCERFAVGH